MNIIPAIDIIDGKCVRLSKGNYKKKKIYSINPLDMALRFEENGINRLHLVDLDGARKGKIIHWKILENIANYTSLIIDFGGGIKSKKDIDILFESGAHIITIGSIAIIYPKIFQEWIDFYGKKKIILSVDVKNNKLVTNAWLKYSKISLEKFLKKNINFGIKKIICTDISKDGMLSGPGINLYKKIFKKFPKINIIASGGIRNLSDLKKLKKIGCKSAIIGKALYEGNLSLKDLKKINKKKC
jgi:phosphoribosylformimino-5-aminoimidazole carboxamide ribotide isomerase